MTNSEILVALLVAFLVMTYRFILFGPQNKK
jgi:hypothetical protein